MTPELAEWLRACPALTTPDPTVVGVFTPQPHPLFYASRTADGQILTGRVVGWHTDPGSPPDPVVVFVDGQYGSYPAVRVNLMTQMIAGPFWLGDSTDEVGRLARDHPAAAWPPRAEETRKRKASR